MTLSLRPIFFRLSTFKLHRYPYDFSQEGIYAECIMYINIGIYIQIYLFFFTSFRNSPVFFSSILFDLYRYSIRVILLLLFVIIIIIRYCEHGVFVDEQINSSRDLRGHRVVTISRWWVVHAAATSNRSNFAPTTVYTPTLGLPNHLYVYLKTKTTLLVTSTST